MGASKQAMFEEMDEERIRDYVYEAVANGDDGINDIAKRITKIEHQNQDLLALGTDLTELTLMVAYVIKNFGFNNPEVQVARLDPDNKTHTQMLINEALCVLRTPMLGRNLAGLIEDVLRGNYDKLQKSLLG